MYQYHTLENGIRIVFKHNASSVTHSGVYIKVGSRDENGNRQMEGMAHFIEHAIFKGTTHRRSYHILNRIDGVGGELNAFTTKEETCIYASSLSVHLERCLELFSDMLFNSTFPEKEIEREKDVVLEEINSYKDTPSELIYDDFEEYIFGKHPLAHNILGSEKNVRRFSSEMIKEFFHRNYTPDRMVISVVGNVEFKKLIALCHRWFVERAPLSGQHDSHPITSAAKPEYDRFDITLNRHTHQMHAMVGCPSFDSRKVPMSLLNNMIGGPAMNSRLNMAIREKFGFCYSVESQYSPFSDAGLFYIYAGIDADAKEHFLELVHRVLSNLRNTPLTTSQLHATQRQYIGQMAINNESPLNEMQAMGKSLLIYDSVDTLEEMQRDIMAVTPRQIQEIADCIFADGNLSYLFYK